MRLLRTLALALGALLLVALLAGGGGYLWLRRSLPVTSGQLRAPGLAAPVQVVRDRDGVPHIRAQSEADALFALGYVHAQDRLWQMEFQRRVGQGRLSELFGPATLDTDRFLRTLGVYRAAQSAYGALDPATRALLDAYAAGVNASVEASAGRLPVEFTILGVAPEPWRPEDSLAWAKMMAWDLGGNWGEELLRADLEARVGPEAAAELMPASAADDPLILPDGGRAVAARGPAPGASPPSSLSPPDARAPAASAADGYGALLAIGRELRALGLGGEHVGSNNWVVAGSRTASGLPLLANDPHLGARMPSIWYLAHVSGGAINAVGATLPGLPGVVIGHNGHIAWGVTNTNPDVQDLFVERVNQRNEALYRGQWEPMTVIPELIRVKGEDDVELFVRVTRHGPLISDVTDGTGQPLAFRWTALDPEDRTLEAFLGVNRARGWDEFTAALRGYHAPMQNFVYADVEGNIGYYAPGALPIRAGGDGTAPAEGWTGESDWLGYVPFEALPHELNPARGYIVTANNQAVPDGYPYQISTAWAAPYRARRIVELVEGGGPHTVAGFAAMQADVVSLQARELLPLVTQIAPADERERAALELLRGWDGATTGDSAAAAVYQAYYNAMAEAIFADELRDGFADEYTFKTDYHAILLPRVLGGELAAWCDDVNTPAAEGCDAALGKALAAGLEHMAEAQGTGEIAAWRWDRVHSARFPHNPFDQVAALRPTFSREVPNGGDDFTVNVAAAERDDLYVQRNVPSYRQIVDLGDLDASQFMHTTGQSGHPLSPGYDNLLGPWQRVEYLPMRFGAAAVDAGAADTLTLTP
mgnify:CR=1 FL=1